MSGRSRVAGVLACVLLMLSLPWQGPAEAALEPAYVSHPSQIPLLDEYDTPQLRPGGDGGLAFDLTNRYAYNITSLRLGLEIYRFANLDTAEAADHLDEVPTFTSGTAVDVKADSNRTGLLFVLPDGVQSGGTLRFETRLHASVHSELGTYLVRCFIRFEMENETFWMRSRGYFDDVSWYRFEEHGNLTRLGEESGVGALNGIVPDTSFGVKEPDDFTAFYVIVGFVAFFGVLSLFFYLMDEKGRFPGAKGKLDGAWDRVRGRKPPTNM